MISYSKVFKSSNVSLLDEVKVIKPAISIPIHEKFEEDASDVHEEAVHPKVRQILYEAEVQAQAIMNKAEKKAQSIEETAQNQVKQMLEENQKMNEALSHEAMEKGFNEGFALGKQEAEKQIQQQYDAKLEQVQQLLEQIP